MNSKALFKDIAMGTVFVQRDDGEADIYLPPNEMRAVLHKDRVKARVVRQDRRGRPEGRVVEIVERPEQPIIGRLLHEGGIWLVAPEDKRYGQDVLIPKGATGPAKVGQVVVVQLTEPPALFGQPVGRVKRSAGRDRRPRHGNRNCRAQVRRAARVFRGVPGRGQGAAREGRPADKKGRVDLTDIPLVTIDGEDARDFDDAVYCEPAKVGRGKGWRLLVAIADVSAYVQTGSPSTSTPTTVPPASTFRAASFRCCPRSCRTACAR
jgi:ribonuclease R